ncbi:MAG: type IV pilin N-terminal domain-containing protein [Methanospirillum sp.]|nr:type IV pilin N-terminal domain-containing protein [Methanospirillum sp.]
MTREHAVSHVQGVLLMVCITVLLFLLIMAFLLGFLPLVRYDNTLAPPLIKIIAINHHGAKLEGHVTIQSFSSVNLNNDDLQAILYANKKKVLANIFTLHGTDFIPTHHFGVKTISGSGCREKYFSPGEIIVIDLKNGYIKPGDSIELRIYQKSDDKSITPVRGNILDDAYMAEYVSENIFSPLQGYRLYSQHWYIA